MFLVWVRRVFRDTMSSRAMSGPLKSVLSSRSTSSSRSLSGSLITCLAGRFTLSLRQRLPGGDGHSSGRSPVSRPLPAGPPWVDLRPQRCGHSPLAQPASGRVPAAQAQRDVALHLVGKRLQNQDFDDASRPPAFFRCLQEALQESHCLKHGAVCTVALIPGQEHPGQGDVLELAQVAKVVLGGQALLPRPVEGFTQPPLRDPHPCLQRRDRTHIWEKVTHVQVLCLVKQVERAVQISLGLPYSSHRDAPAIPVLREPSVLALLLASQQVLRGGMQIVMLTVELTHSHVHVCRSPQYRLALLRRKLQSPLIGTHRLAETTLRNPYISQGDCATDCVRDVPGLLHTSHAIGKHPVCCLEIPARPGCESQERRCRSAPEMVVLRYEVEHPPGVFHGAGHIAQARASPARYMAIEPGRRRNSSSSTTTISADRASGRSRMSAVVSSHRSASRSRSSTASNSPLASNAPAYSTLSTGLTVDTARRGAPSASRAP